ncbi:MAG: MFS transporter, partial [Fimbriimonadaceae bacterium]|nr:MFS transporter [Chitinophagales bacterium]
MQASQNNSSPLKIKEFRHFLSMRVFITFAFLIQYVVAGWEIYSITKDPLSLGLIGLAEAIPAIGIALYAGHLADISNKRNLLIAALCGMFLSSAGLTIFTSDYMQEMNSDDVTVKLMYLFIFTTGLARGFYAPTATSFIVQLVRPTATPKSPEGDLSSSKVLFQERNFDAIDEDELIDGESKKINDQILVRASTINSTVWQMSAIIGPALGGFIYAGFGMTFSMYCVLGCILLGIIFMTFIKS